MQIVCIGCDRELDRLAFSFFGNLNICAKCFTNTVKSYLDEGMDIDGVTVIKHHIKNGKFADTETYKAKEIYDVLSSVCADVEMPLEVFLRRINMRKYNEDEQYKKFIEEIIRMLSNKNESQ